MSKEKFTKILKFSICSESFGLKVSDILEVNLLPEIMPFHGPDESVIGLINFHGKSMPLIALSRLLILEQEVAGKKLFIAVKTKEGPLCFSVDELNGFEQVSENEVRRLNDTAYKIDVEYLDFVFLIQ